MAVDKLVDSGKLDACCAAEAAAIIAKGGGTAPLAYDFANNKGFADAIAAIPSGGGSLPLRLELIGTETVELQETTSTTVETIDTNIDVGSTDYLFGYITIECDGVANTQSEWGGLTFASFWRSRQTNGNMLSYDECVQVSFQGVKTLSLNTYVNTPSNGSILSGNVGVYISGSVKKVRFNRKCTANVPKIMGGTYTVRVYGVAGV